MEQQIALASLAKVFGIDESTFSAMFVEQADGAEPQPITGDAVLEKLSSIAQSEKLRYMTEGEKKGKRERMTEFEKKAREKYGTNFNQQGEALLDAIVSTREAELAELKAKILEFDGKKSSFDDMPEDKKAAFVVNHPIHTAKIKALEEQVLQAKTDLENFARQVEANQVFAMVEKEGMDALNEYAPILPSNETVAKNQVRLFIQQLKEAAQYKVIDNTLTALDKNGDKVKDSDYRELTFRQHVQTLAANFFEAHPADPKKSAPGAGSTGAGSGAGIPDWSKMTETEIFKLILGEQDAGKKAILNESAARYLSGGK